jgi:hypothetical protein
MFVEDKALRIMLWQEWDVRSVPVSESEELVF